MKVAVGVAALLVMLLAAGALLAGRTPGSDAVGGVSLVSDCVRKAEHPISVIFSCSDGSFAVHDITWTGWGGEQAQGSGTAEINDCNPTCPDGKFNSYPIELTASRRQECGAGDVRYTEVGFSFPGGSPFPPGSPQAQSSAVDFSCSLFP